MSWNDAVRFGITHELCSGSTQVADVDDGLVGAQFVNLRCSGCGASKVVEVSDKTTVDALVAIYDALGPLAEKIEKDPTMLDTEEGQAQIAQAIEARPALKQMVEAILSRSRQRETRH